MAKRLGGGEGCSFQRCPSFQTAPINAEYQVDWGFGNEALVATEPGQAGAGVPDFPPSRSYGAGGFRLLVVSVSAL